MPERALPQQSDGPTIVTTRGRTHLTVECDSCGWFCTVGSYDAIRMAGRRHAEREGHRVVGFSERATYWDGTPAVVAARTGERS
jgi:hypothetical protein